MTILIPFANPLGPHSGPGGDGAIHTVLPRSAPVAAVSSAASVSGSRILRGNADAGGANHWTSLTTAANDDIAGDVTIFDGVNPTNDVLLYELVAGDDLQSIDFLQSVAGVFTGTPVAEVYWRSSGGSWVTATGVGTPVLTTTGVKRVTFDPILYSLVGLIDDPVDPRNNPQLRAVFVRFTGVTGVTTAPAFTRTWKRRSATAARVLQTFTPLVNQGETPNFTPYTNIQLLPLSGDLSLVGFPAPVAKMRIRIERPRTTPATEIVYSTGGGTWAVLPAASLLLAGSAGSADELWTAAALTPRAWVEDVIIPPSDWLPNTLTVNSVNLSHYWFGLRYTADATGLSPILLLSVDAQAFQLTGSAGTAAPVTGTYTKLEAYFRETSPTPSVLLIANLTTGKSVSVTIPANTASSTAAISLATTVGDLIGVQQLSGDDILSVADGYIRLS